MKKNKYKPVYPVQKINITGLFVICYLLFVICPAQAQWLGALIPDFRVNDDNTTLTQGSPSIGVDGEGNFVIVWNDPRIYPGRVYCQIFDIDGNRIRNNFGIGQDTCGLGVITVLKDGRFIVSYANNRNIYQQRYNKLGYPLGPWGMVNDVPLPDTVVVPNYPGSIGTDSSGNYVVAWTDNRYGSLNTNVYGQRYDSSGNKLGNNFRVNDIMNHAGYPGLAVNKDGSFIVTWQEYRSTGIKIYMQRYNRFGNAIGINQRVDDDTTTTNSKSGAVTACDGNGNFVIAFADYRYSINTAVIFYQLYDLAGNKIGGNQRADVGIGPDKGATKISMQTDGKFVINWIDDRTGKDIGYCQRFNSDGTKININFPIPLITSFNNSTYGIFLYNLRIYSTWPDIRNSNWDIYANIRSFINPDSIFVSISSNQHYLKEFKLYPSYPNPFNPITNIKFFIPNSTFEEGKESDYVKLIVYDVLGREVAILINEKLTSGTYLTKWDAGNNSSGLYFVKLTAGSNYSAIQKLVLMK
ncbi:MAG: T9SS C-terminal target domain-containing protein [Ignavibacteriae bacterium]|nr:MAG: T9SS C-terminal target domain-containing protein [Ignavibacteriota bacterium]